MRAKERDKEKIRKREREREIKKRGVGSEGGWIQKLKTKTQTQFDLIPEKIEPNAIKKKKALQDQKITIQKRSRSLQNLRLCALRSMPHLRPGVGLKPLRRRPQVGLHRRSRSPDGALESQSALPR